MKHSVFQQSEFVLPYVNMHCDNMFHNY